MPRTIIELLKNGTRANYDDAFRRGNLVELPAMGSLIITGDLHGHRRNFERIVTFADLPNNPERHVILQEIIHGGPEDLHGGCLSYKLLLDAVRYQAAFPGQVHLIMGNHDTAFILNSEVMKDGKEMNRAMCMALEREYKQAGGDIIQAMKNYLFSQPLAVRCENRIWISHSLPADRFADKFDPKIMERPLQIDDITRPGSAYLLTWGRNLGQELIDKMAKMFDVDVLVVGHQQQDQGWCKAGKNLLILASNHNHGHMLSINLEKNYNIEQLIDALVPLASIV
ncbi:MAG: metallophosphoesterase [Sedimentisphaerales bacterium]|nr:metallophosphoesterase [Sedimentisphaerales bacterium]